MQIIVNWTSNYITGYGMFICWLDINLCVQSGMILTEEVD